MLLLRLILIPALLMFTATMSFAASGWWSGAINTKSKIVDKIDKGKNDDDSIRDTNTEERKVENRRTEQMLWDLAIEASKIQWNKVLRDLYISIQKSYPDPKVQIEFYTSIQKTLEFRKNKLEKSEFSDEAKYIIRGYLEYMIVNIEKKRKNLE